MTDSTLKKYCIVSFAITVIFFSLIMSRLDDHSLNYSVEPSPSTGQVVRHSLRRKGSTQTVYVTQEESDRTDAKPLIYGLCAFLIVDAGVLLFLLRGRINKTKA